MAPRPKRRRLGVSTVKSTSYELTSFLDAFTNSQLTVKELILKILKQSGPYTATEIFTRCINSGRPTTGIYGVRSALTELKARGLIVHVNGGYAIKDWENIGQ